MEDYGGNFEFTLFSESYLKLKHFLVPNSFLFLSGKADLRWKTTDQFEFKIGQIQLLSEVRDKKIKTVTLQMSLADLSDGIINEVNEIINNNPGNVSIKINVSDPGEKISIDMLSKKYKISPNNEFLERLKNVKGLKCVLN